jgi:hypothetical protein
MGMIAISLRENKLDVFWTTSVGRRGLAGNGTICVYRELSGA